MEINDLPTNSSPTGDLKIELSDGNKATLSSLPISSATQTVLDGKQPLDADLTSYANAADAAARRALIGAETSGAAAAAQAAAIAASCQRASNLSDLASAATARTNLGLGTAATTDASAYDAAGAAATVQSNLTTHTSDTAPHGATSANTASRIVARSSEGVSTLSGVQLDTAATPTDAIGLIRWNATDQCAEYVTAGGVVIQMGQEETIYVRNNSGATIANGEAVYVTGASGQRPTISKATGNSASASKMMGLVTTDAGILNNGFGHVTISGLVHNLDTSAFTDGAELYLSPTTAGAVTATVPTGDTQRIVRVGYVVHAHANQGTILVKTHYQGTPIGNNLMESEGAAAARTALGLGSLATQSGTFSGTSSGTNTGDQDLSGLLVKASNLSDLTNAATARTNLGLGTLATQSGTFSGTSSGTNTGDQDLSGFLVKSSNLSDLTNAATARTNLGLGTLATQSGTFSGTSSGTNTGDQTITLTGDVTGSGTGSFAATISTNAVGNTKLAQVSTNTIKGRTTAGTGDVQDLTTTQVRSMLSISNVDNTSDANKPVSTAQQTALNLKADLASPALTGNPTAPTQAALDRSTKLATTKYADDADFAQTAALIEREGLRFDGTAGATVTWPAVGTGDFTIAGLANAGDLSARKTIAASGSSSAWSLTVETNGKIGIFLAAVGNVGFSTGTVSAGKPFAFAYTRSGTTGTFYLDAAASGTASDPENYSSTTNARIGSNSSGGDIFNGSITGIKYFNYALTAAEISALTRRGLVTLPEQRGGSMTAINAGSFVVGKKYRISTVGTTSFTSIGASANTVGVEFTATGVGSGTGTALPLGTLFEQDSGQRNAGYMVRDSSGNGRHLELPATGVSINDPSDTGFIEYTRTTDGYLIGDRRVIPSTGYLVEVVATGDGTVTLGESAGTPANVVASVTLTSTPKILTLLVTQTSNGKLYADLGTATTATFKIRHRAV